MLKNLIFLLLLIISCKGGGEKELIISGRIEGDEYDIGTKLGGRIEKVFVKEGEDIRKGKVLAKIDSKEIEAKLERAKANVDYVKKLIKIKESEIEVLKRKLESLKIKKEALEKEAQLSIKTAIKNKELIKKKIKALKHKKKQLEVSYEKLKRDYERFKRLFKKGVIPRSKYEEIETKMKATLEEIKSVESAIEEAFKTLEISNIKIELAKLKKKEVKAFEKEVSSLEETIKAKERELNSLYSKLKEAQALYYEVKAIYEDTFIVSPIDGTVVEKLVEDGEVVAPGKRLFTIVNLDKLYFKGYIPERKLGYVRLGQEAYIIVDSFPDRKFKGVVSYVSDKAEFTPKEVQTREARVKQVFAIKIYLKENPNHILKPGMPADAVIELK